MFDDSGGGIFGDGFPKDTHTPDFAPYLAAAHKHQAKRQTTQATSSKTSPQWQPSDGGFPPELMPNGLTTKDYPVPTIPFEESNAGSLKAIFDHDIEIFVTPTHSFTTRFREIFQKTKLPLVIEFRDDKSGITELKKCYNGPDMKYWPQQLNFATWCATTGCGVSRELFEENHSTLELPPVVRSFYKFHVYFTIRKILWLLPQTRTAS